MNLKWSISAYLATVPTLGIRYFLISQFILVAAIFPLTAGISGGQGVLEIRVKDHREAIGDFDKLILTIEAILISPKPGLKFWQTRWKSLDPTTKSFDLTKYVGAESVRIFQGALDPGKFDAVNLKLKKTSGLLKKSGGDAPIKNLLGPIRLPFEVRAQGETQIVLDLVVLDMSDHPPQGYELAVRGYELYTNGKLVDRVPPG
ncbi:MAG TPA: DUF4382 domain-containing protein [Candidatus Binatia bacterium]|nr:DUF4382 domain-containing protein [Candidatus Binatia bacterium]